MDAAPGDHPPRRLREVLRRWRRPTSTRSASTPTRTRRRSSRPSRSCSASPCSRCARPRCRSKPKRRGYTAGRTRAWKKAVVQVARGRLDPDLPGPGGRALDADPQAQAHLARPALRHLPDFARDHEDRAGEDASPRASRSPAAATPTAARPPATAAAAPSACTARSTSSARKDGVPGQGGRDRVRPQPVGLHRAAALRRRREGATSSPRTACASA